jgi:hypothetical protein
VGAPWGHGFFPPANERAAHPHAIAWETSRGKHERRVSKSGDVTWRVAWREGGTRTGCRDSETCDDRDTARKFANLVELVLATEPGGREREHQRHRQFAALRVHGEWFRLEVPFTDHIKALGREAAGE